MKRLLDFSVALAALLLLSPLLLVIAVWIRIRLGAPVIFKQMRPGLRSKPFMMYKFRTMTEAKDMDGNLLPDSERLSSFGHFLRRTSIDELPELFNVLKGDMSLVGPRPLLMEYLPLYTPEQARRHEVRPGITGWAQINGRQSLSWSRKFEMDSSYVENASVWLDIKILASTIVKVIIREGVKAGSSDAEDDVGIWKQVLRIKEEARTSLKEGKPVSISYEQRPVNRFVLYDFLLLVDMSIPRPLSSRKNLLEYAEKLERDALIVSAWQGFKLVGINAIYIYNPDDLSGFITWIAVLPEHQGKGIGSELMCSGIELIRATGKQYVKLVVDTDNVKAKKFYEGFGFSREERVSDDSLHMICKINPAHKIEK